VTETALTTAERRQADRPVLSVRDLHVRFATENGTVHAVRGLDFDLRPGQVLGIVGESGSGKSATSLAVLQLLADNASVTGEVLLDGKNLLELDDRQMCAHRGKDISIVFQDPLSSLTPVLSVGRQISDALAVHNPGMDKAARRARAVELLDMVGIPSPEERFDAYPHEFSGGMRQRVVIAIAIANNPRVIICDEPTTALDVTIQAQVLDVLQVARRETGAAVVFITHDLGVLAGIADEILVMYAGRGVERGPAEEVYHRPRMPYTMGLLAAVPRVDRADRTALVPIEGSPPNLLSEPVGCSFADRCPLVRPECRTAEPELRPVGRVEGGATHLAACVRSQDVAAGTEEVRAAFRAPEIPAPAEAGVPRQEREVVLAVGGLTKTFTVGGGLLRRRRSGTVHAVDGISFDVRRGECLSLVGESGCGKSSALLEVMEFDPQQPGQIAIGGVPLHGPDGRSPSAADVRRVRRGVQIVFQDSLSAMDPRFTVFDVIAEPLDADGWSRADIRRRVFELLELVGLQTDHVNRFPGQFSGGQRQRIAIARALALNPALVVLDEPVSALDVSIQAGVVNLLDDLRARLGLSYLFVAHDLAVVRHISDQVAVMYLGTVVEHGDVDTVFDDPKHPYTRALLSAIPVPDPTVERNRQRIVLQGGLPSPLQRSTGCRFASRCPVFAALPPAGQERCRTTVPELRSAGPTRVHACHFPDEPIPTTA
jgi:peptide/nickel transport system ATP-binding protein